MTEAVRHRLSQQLVEAAAPQRGRFEGHASFTKQMIEARCTIDLQDTEHEATGREKLSWGAAAITGGSVYRASSRELDGMLYVQSANLSKGALVGRQ